MQELDILLTKTVLARSSLSTLSWAHARAAELLSTACTCTATDSASGQDCHAVRTPAKGVMHVFEQATALCSNKESAPYVYSDGQSTYIHLKLQSRMWR